MQVSVVTGVRTSVIDNGADPFPIANQPRGLRFRKILLASVLSVSVTVGGCQTMQDVKKLVAENPEAMALVGGVLGAYAGRDGKGRIIGALLGAGVGFALSKLVEKLNQKEQQQLAAAQQSSVVRGNAGDVQQWVNPDNGTKIKVKTVKSGVEETKSDIIRAKAVQSPGKMKLLGVPYEVVPGSVNIRSGPSTSTSVVRKVLRGDVLTAVGQPIGTNWYMVAHNGVSVGYIRQDLMRKAQNGQQTGIQDKTEFKDVDLMVNEMNRAFQSGRDSGAPAVDVTDVVPATGSNKDVIRPAEGDGSVADLFNSAASSGFVVETVDATTVCKDIETTITVKETSDSATSKACKAGDGAWNVTASS